MTDEKKAEDYSLGKVLPAIMTFLTNVAKDDNSAYQKEAHDLSTDLLLAAIMGIGKAVGAPEAGRRAADEARAALDGRDGHDPYGR